MIGKFLAGTLSILFISLANADSWNDFLLQSLEKQVRAEVEGFLPTPLPKGGVISSNFGKRIHPIYKDNRQHNGIDIVSDIGTLFVSVSDGKVINAGFSESQGNFVQIKHSSNVSMLYAHAQSTFVSIGETVTKGQVIGSVGNAGLVTGAHLHVELIVWDEFYDPLIFLKSDSINVVALPEYVQATIGHQVQTETDKFSAHASLDQRTVWSIANELMRSTMSGDIHSIIEDIVSLNPLAFPTGDASYRHADIPLLLPEYKDTITPLDEYNNHDFISETTWSLSGELGNQFNVTRYQAMKGLYDMNEAAFIGRDINKRRADVPITIPDPEYLRSIPSELAYRWFIEIDES